MPSLSLPLSLTLQLSAAPIPDNPLLLPALPAPAEHSASLLLTDLVISAGAAASPYWIDPDPRLRGSWTCHGVDNATLDVAARCPLARFSERLPR